MPNFSCAQTFYVDPARVNNADEIGITSVSLYFRSKPNITNNKSGIYSPGVSVFIAPTFQGVPLVDNSGIIDGAHTQIIYSRCEYGAIIASSAASVATIFKFTQPISVLTNQQYAIIIKFDGDEDFVLWSSIQGDLLLGTNKASPGPSGKYIGAYFDYISPVGAVSLFANTTLSNTSVIPGISGQTFSSPSSVSVDYLLSNWRAINNKDLKFSVDVARYAYQGVPMASNNEIVDNTFIGMFVSNNFVVLANNVMRLIAPCYPMEFIYYTKKYSNPDQLHYGDRVFQMQPYYSGGKSTPATLSVTNNSITIDANAYIIADNTSFNFTKMFDFNSSHLEYIIVTSLNHYGANQHAINVRRVVGKGTSNNQIVVNEALTFTNTTAYFYKSPVARLYNFSRPYVSGKERDFITLVDSNANATCRFVNNTINSTSINVGGSGYNNSDYLVVSGFESVTNEVLGGYNATANLVTNATGGITSLIISNSGAGFVNSSLVTYSIFAANGSASNGSSANVGFTIDATLLTQLNNGNTYFKGLIITNLDSQQVIPNLTINNPMGTIYSVKYKSLYHSIVSANTFSGRTNLVDTTLDQAIEIDVKNNEIHNFIESKTPLIVSRSNQFVIGYANGSIPNTSISGTYLSNCAVLYIDFYANNDFTSISFKPTDLNTLYGKYNINNDYTNENTNYGNAYAKHVSTKVSLANSNFSEDLIVFLTAIKPAGTDIKVLARIHNSHDSDAFDDKDWTLMECVSGNTTFTNITNPDERVELTYNFPMYPNTASTLGGVVTTSANSATITGIGTTLSSNLASGDLIKLYQPLFANSDYMIAVVNVATNATSITINTPVTNNSLVASGMKIDKISYKLQAFKNITNDNCVRYYTNNQVTYDTFDTMQLKIVMLSNNDYIIPKIDDCRAVCLTA